MMIKELDGSGRMFSIGEDLSNMYKTIVDAVVQSNDMTLPDSMKRSQFYTEVSTSFRFMTMILGNDPNAINSFRCSLMSKINNLDVFVFELSNY